MGIRRIFGLLAGIIFCFTNISSFGQTILRGIVLDDKNKPVPEALVFDTLDYSSTLTDSFGKFSLNLSSLPREIYIQHVSFLPYNKFITTDAFLTISLSPNSLETIVVTSISNFQNKRSGRVSINKTVIDALPSIGGEVDYIKSLVLFPGVSNGEEISKGITVRGGSLDQNLAHINGVQTSNTGHLFNLFSVMPAVAVKDISFYKGGLPAHFGNALASSMDINLRKPTKKVLQMELGATNSKISFENTIGKQKKTSFLLSGRSSYIDLLRRKSEKKTINNFMPRGADGSGPQFHFGYTFFDLFGSLHVNLGKGYSFEGFGLYSYDLNTYIYNRTYITHLKHDLINATYGVKLSKKWKNQSLDLIGGMNENNIKRKEKNLNFDAASVLIEDKYLYHAYGIKNWTGKLDYEINNKRIDIKMGLFSYYKNYKPSNGLLETYSYDPLLQTSSFVKDSNNTKAFNLLLNGIYFQTDIKLSECINTHLGLRASQFITTPMPFNAIEPRFSIDYGASHTTNFRFSFDYLTQFDHGLLLSEAGLDNEIFIPSFGDILPAKSLLYSLGATQKLADQKLFISTEVYYRNLWNLQRLALDGKDNIVSDTITELIAGNGTGLAYGFELQATYQHKSFLFNASYTYTRSWRKFESFNNEQAYHFNYDKPHELSLSGVIGLGKKSSFSFNFTLTNGSRYTLPSGIVPSVFGSGKPTLIYDGFQNEARLPLYHRLDVGYDYKFKLTSKWRAMIKLNVVNLYNRRNTNFIEIVDDQNQNFHVEGISYFPLLPSLNIKLTHE